MNRCKTCKWWDSKPYLDPELNDEKCIVRQCMHSKVNGESSDFMGEDVLTQCGTDAGYPTNCTGPEYGCVHWEMVNLFATYDVKDK